LQKICKLKKLKNLKLKKQLPLKVLYELETDFIYSYCFI
jgi:hypothetical protein